MCVTMLSVVSFDDLPCDFIHYLSKGQMENVPNEPKVIMVFYQNCEGTRRYQKGQRGHI